MATYCISDIHGRYSDWMQVMDAAGISDSDRIIVHGDIIDRGPETRRCLRFAMNAPDNFEFLLGNHEDMFASFITMHGTDEALSNGMWQMLDYHPWIRNTSRSDRNLLYDTIVFGEHERLRKWYVDDVVPWIHRLPLSKTVKMKSCGHDRTFVIVHAGIEVDGRRIACDSMQGYDGIADGQIDVECAGLQSKQKMLWMRSGFIDDMTENDPYDIVCGHTPMTARYAQHLRFIAEWEGVKHDYRGGYVCHMAHRHFTDCGSAYRRYHRECDLGMLRLDDMSAFYAKKGGPIYPDSTWLDWYSSKGQAI